MRGYTYTAAAVLLAAASVWFGWQHSASAGQHSTKALMVQQSSDQNAQRMDQMQKPSGTARTNPSGTQGSMDQQQGAMLPQGITQKNLSDFEDVRKTFTSFSKSVLKKDNFKDVTDYFVESDRNRLSSAGNQNDDAWNKAVDDFEQAWKSKYNRSFDVKDRDKAYSDRFLSVTQGQVDNPQQITTWPVTPMKNLTQSWQKIASSPNIQKGTQVAVAMLTPDTNHDPLNVSLIREGSSWKIDIPDTVSADDLKASFAQHLNEVTNMKDQWPSDPNDAARVVTYHLLTACYTAGSAGQTSQSGTSGTWSKESGSSSTPSSSTDTKTTATQSGSSSTPSSSTDTKTTATQSGTSSEQEDPSQDESQPE